MATSAPTQMGKPTFDSGLLIHADVAAGIPAIPAEGLGIVVHDVHRERDCRALLSAPYVVIAYG